MVDLLLLGCGGGMPMPNRFLSSLLISYRGRKILIDCGEGTQVSMRISNTGFKSIDVICITHIHGDIELSTLELDHSSPCIGYSFYFKRKSKFDVKKAIENNVPKILWSKLQKNKEKIVLEGKEYTKEMVIGEERKGIKIAMITDTRPNENIEEFIKNSDYLICEGTYGDQQDLEKAIKNKHMTFKEAAILANNGEIKKVIKELIRAI